MASESERYNIVVVGPAYVGKSALILRLVKLIFVHEYEPTLEDVYYMQAVIDDKSFLLSITDTSGMPGYYSMLENEIRRADGLLCVYSVDSMESFNYMQDYLNKIRLISEVPVLLVGNKCDLGVEGEREVNNYLGKLCAQQYGIEFFTTSALTGKRVQHCFHTLVRLIRKYKTAAPANATKHACCTIC